MLVDLGLSKRREEFLTRATARLGTYPSDFQSEFERITVSGRTATPRLAAGVLLPLVFRGTPGSGTPEEGEFVFQLIKRSSLVRQPGDLSCPAA